MRKGLVEILCILDRSGSMESIRDDAIGGFNAFVEAQRGAPGEALLSLVLFDNEYEVPLDGVPLKEVPRLTRETFVPRGATALLDAIGRTMDRVLDRHRQLPEADRPEKVLVAILTDGAENASRLFTRDLVFQEITTRQEAGAWEFVFLAANQDAIASGAALGIRPGASIAFIADSYGTRGAFETATAVLTSHRQDLVDPPDEE